METKQFSNLGNSMNEIITENLTIDSILSKHKNELGNDFEKYKNHVYRVYNLCLYLGLENDRFNILEIVVAFHDIGIWTHNTFDYLPPSEDLANNFCHNANLNPQECEIVNHIITNHHKLRSIKDQAISEIFRKADLVDLTLGIFTFGIQRTYLKKLNAAFPNKGFHFLLIKLSIKRFITNPLSPLPMYKF
jgi:hypothetical protein